jgi:hypothetical protein
MRSHCVILSVSYDLTVILSVSCDLTDIIIIIRSHYVILSVSYDLTVWYYQYHTISLCDIISINKLRWMLKIIGQCDVKHIMMLPIKTIINKPISELQISCVFAFFTLWKRVKAHVLSDQSVHLRIHITVYANFPNSERTCTLLTIIHRVHKQYIFDFEKFPVITSLYTFWKRKCIHPRGTECLPF